MNFDTPCTIPIPSRQPAGTHGLPHRRHLLALGTNDNFALHKLIALLEASDKAFGRVGMLLERKHGVEVVLYHLMTAAAAGARKNAPDEARHAVRAEGGGGKVQDAPEGDKVGRVGVVLDVADGTTGDGRGGEGRCLGRERWEEGKGGGGGLRRVRVIPGQVVWGGRAEDRDHPGGGEIRGIGRGGYGVV